MNLIDYLGILKHEYKFKTVERLVNLNADRKRMWFEDLIDVNNGRMINSLPLSMNFI